MIIEEVTLGALARALASAREEPTSQILCQAQAQAARSSRLGSARLVELRTACARIATVGEYYKLRARVPAPPMVELAVALIGATAIVLAFAWPFH